MAEAFDDFTPVLLGRGGMTAGGFASGPGNCPSKKDGCWTEGGKCRFNYPKPLSPVTHIDPVTGRVIYSRVTEEDRMVVGLLLALFLRPRKL